MTNMKRALSLVIVLALALSMVAMGASAAKFEDVPETYSYSTEVQFLSDLDILSGYPDGSYKPDGIVTRAEASAVIYRMLSGKNSAANYEGDTKFPDVIGEHWASGYVNFCVELGIIAGYPDGNFYPEQTLTYAEYTTMLVRALGLDSGKDPQYPFGYISLATIEGVNEDVDLQASEACNRGAVAKLTYNSILNATYARIANNIYVTERPTIAKDVLKLISTEGVLTSTGYYDFTGDNAAGLNNFRLAKFDKDTNEYDEVLTAEFDVDVAELGKKATVWYKEDSTATNGMKVYAVITKAAKEFAINHISLRGAYREKSYELTYVVSDIDRYLQMDKNCQFIENNEFLFRNDLGEYIDRTGDFYPVSTRSWLPVSYKFIDTDNDGDYDFAIRTTYAFDRVSNLTASRLLLDGQSSTDRKDNAGNAYAWNDDLADVSVGDYVLFTCDGAVSDSEGAFSADNYAPNLGTSLYNDTRSASFTKISMVTGDLEGMTNGDQFIFDGKTYRAMRGISFGDPDIGDTFEYYPLSKFAMIGKADAISTSSGKYIVVTDFLDSSYNIGNNFQISGYIETDDKVDFTVKASKTKGFIDVNGDEGALMGASTDEDNYLFKLFEYKTNSAGQITELKDCSDTGATVPAGDAGYTSKSKLLNTSEGSYMVDDSSLVFVEFKGGDDVGASGADYKVYVGGLPKINASSKVYGLDVKTSSTGVDKLKAVFISTKATTLTGTTENEDCVGYLRSVSTDTTADGTAYKYTFAYDGELDKVFYSPSVSKAADITDLIADENVIGLGSNLGGPVVFDINADGTISNMRRQETVQSFYDSTADYPSMNPDTDTYMGTFVALTVDTSNKYIRLLPVFDATTEKAVTAGATLYNSSFTGNLGSVDTDLIAYGDARTFKVASDASVYVFDVTQTNQAYVEIGSLGSILKADIDDVTAPTDGDILHFISVEIDTDDNVITAIFYNDRTAFVGNIYG